MYTFYFRACAAALSATTRAKLIAVKGIHTPIYPALGQEYGEDTMRALVENGHKVIIEPKKPSSAPDPSVCHDKGDTAVPTMRYAKGYRAPNLGDKVSYLDASHIYLGDVAVSVPWESWPSLDFEQPAPSAADKPKTQVFTHQNSQNTHSVGEYKEHFTWTPPKSVHFTDDGCRLTRWERIKAWFSRNFIPA